MMSNELKPMTKAELKELERLKKKALATHTKLSYGETKTINLLHYDYMRSLAPNRL